MITIDLNADLDADFGVWRLGVGDALLDVITSANVACGGHAGDPSTMRRACAAAAERGISLGAQVGYRDLTGFGQRHIEYDGFHLRDEVLYQLAALDGFCRVAGTRVRYLKPHGVLATTTAVDETQATAVVSAVIDYDRTLPVLCRSGSVLAAIAEQSGLTVIREGFADRGYRPDGTLVPRSSSGALVHDPELVAARAVRMAVERTVVAVDDTLATCPVGSISVHGDTPGAVDLARRVRAAFSAAEVEVRPFA